jgi:hypothetical protein
VAPAVSQEAAAQAADAAGYIIVSPTSSKASGDATFYPTGPISDDTLVVIPNADGSLPGGVTEHQIQSAVAQKRAGPLAGMDTLELSGSDAVARDVTEYSWSATSAGFSDLYTGGSAIGVDDSAQVVYTFSTAEGYDQTAAGNGLGYYRGYNGSEFGTRAKYYGVGNADSSGNGGVAVPWGNVAAVKKFQAQCTKSTVCFGNFS